MDYYIVNRMTGEIVQTGQCQQGCARPMAKTGEEAFTGTADLTTQEYDYVSKSLVSRPPTAAESWVSAHMKRALLLDAADKMVSKSLDTGDTAGEKAARTYRQALRDITKQTDPNNITWPTPPGGI